MGDAINCSLCGENHAPPDCAVRRGEREILDAVGRLPDTTVYSYQSSTPFRHLCQIVCRQRGLTKRFRGGCAGD